MLKIISRAAVLAALLPTAALADGVTTYSILDGGGTSRSFNANQDGSSNYSASVGGFDTGSAPTATATPSGSSHAAGTSIGGLLSVPMARVNGGSGIITNFNYISVGGATSMFVVRIWDKSPGSTTCTDNTAYAGNATDDAHLLSAPFAMSPAAPAVTTGDAKTYYTRDGMSMNFKNQDGSPGKNVYVCVVTVSTDTADESNAVRVILSGAQD